MRSEEAGNTLQQKANGSRDYHWGKPTAFSQFRQTVDWKYVFGRKQNLLPNNAL